MTDRTDGRPGRGGLVPTGSDLAAMLDAAGLEPKKSLGQNFVVDPNTVRRIVRLATIAEGDRVVEIGAGLGSLTLALAEVGADVTAVEIDRQLADLLTDAVAGLSVRVIHADALDLDWAALLGTERGWSLVANLPYNVGVAIVLDALVRAPMIDRMLVMVQREVAERLTATVGTRTFGRPTLAVRLRADARLVGRVPPTVFLPRPRVESALVELVRREPPTTDLTRLDSLSAAAFGQRRKMLRRSLAGVVSPETFTAAGVDATLRPEQLDVMDWVRLTDAVTAT